MGPPRSASGAHRRRRAPLAQPAPGYPSSQVLGRELGPWGHPGAPVRRPSRLVRFCPLKCLAERANSLSSAAAEGVAVLSVRVLRVLTAGGARASRFPGAGTGWEAAGPGSSSRGKAGARLPDHTLKRLSADASLFVVYMRYRGVYAEADEDKEGTKRRRATRERSGVRGAGGRPLTGAPAAGTGGTFASLAADEVL